MKEIENFELFLAKTGQNLVKKGADKSNLRIFPCKKIRQFFKDQTISIYGKNEEHLFKVSIGRNKPK